MEDNISIRGFGIPNGEQVVAFEHDEQAREQWEQQHAPSETNQMHQNQEEQAVTPLTGGERVGDSNEGPRPTITVDVVTRPKRRWMFKTLGVVVTAGALLAGAKYVSEHMPHMPQIGPDATHDLSVEIDKVESEVVYDRTITYATIDSSFDYTATNSLDRPYLPFNCDAGIDQRLETTADADILVSEAKITRKGNKGTIEVVGNLSTATSVDVSSGLPDVKIATGGVDVCNGDNERQWASRIAFGYEKKNKEGKVVEHEDGTVKNAGEIATACAIQKEGEGALVEAIKHNATVFSEKLDGIDPGNITVTFDTDFAEYAQSQVDSSVADFYKEFEDVSTKYAEETSDHQDDDGKANIRLKAKNLVSCDKHTITVVPVS
jgi:hypothetical protein